MVAVLKHLASKPQTVWRPPAGLRLAVLLVGGLFVIAARAFFLHVFAHRGDNANFFHGRPENIVAGAAFLTGAAFTILWALRARLAVHPEAVVVQGPLRARRIPRDAIERVSAYGPRVAAHQVRRRRPDAVLDHRGRAGLPRRRTVRTGDPVRTCCELHQRTAPSGPRRLTAPRTSRDTIKNNAARAVLLLERETSRSQRVVRIDGSDGRSCRCWRRRSPMCGRVGGPTPTVGA